MSRSAIEKIDKPHDLLKVKRAPIHWGGGLERRLIFSSKYAFILNRKIALSERRGKWSNQRQAMLYLSMFIMTISDLMFTMRQFGCNE